MDGWDYSTLSLLSRYVGTFHLRAARGKKKKNLSAMQGKSYICTRVSRSVIFIIEIL